MMNTKEEVCEKCLKTVDITVLGVHPKHCRNGERYYLVVDGIGNDNIQKDIASFIVPGELIDNLRKSDSKAKILERNLMRIDKFCLITDRYRNRKLFNLLGFCNLRKKRMRTL